MSSRTLFPMESDTDLSFPTRLHGFLVVFCILAVAKGIRLINHQRLAAGIMKDKVIRLFLASRNNPKVMDSVLKDDLGILRSNRELTTVTRDKEDGKEEHPQKSNQMILHIEKDKKEGSLEEPPPYI